MAPSFSGLRRFISRIESFLRPGRAERELAREIAAHRVLLEDDLRGRGMTTDEARQATARAFYGVEASKERQRDQRSFGWLEDVRRDLRYAVRVLARQAGFTSIAIITLAVAIGANSAIFTVVRSVLLRPLPYPESDRLVFMYDSFPGAGVVRAGTSVPNYLDRVANVKTLESQALYEYMGIGIGEPGSVEGGAGLLVTPSLFHVLRTRALRGRVFSDSEGESDGARVAILSYGYWQRAFGGSDSAIGRSVRINRARYTIVGVMPDSFAFGGPDVRVWLPLGFSAARRSEDERYNQNADGIGRLAPGASVAQVQQQFDAMTRATVEHAGKLKTMLADAGYRSVVVPFEADMVREVRASLNLLWGGVLFVLLIAAANITNLVLVRASGRTKEVATRYALGAGRGRIARQLITEILLLTVVGGLVGLGLGNGSLRWLSSIDSLSLSKLPRGHEIRMDWVVALFTFGIAVLQGVLISIAPLAQLAGLNLNGTLREDSRTGTAGRGAGLVRRVLVTAQVALAFMLLIGAGLLFASFRQLLAVDPGFRAEQVLSGLTELPSARYPDDAKRSDAIALALTRLRQLPGVAAAGVADRLPFAYGLSAGALIAEGYALAPGESLISPYEQRVTPGYFEALGVPLVRGRYFTDSDTAGAPRAIILDERLARKFWPHADPIGRRVFAPENASEVTPGPQTKWMQVVGVVPATKQTGLVDDKQAELGAYYVPYAQSPTGGVGFVIKTVGDPTSVENAIQQTLRTVDPELQLGDVKTMPERVAGSLDARRTPMLLSLGFGVLALLLASIGIYGVLAYQVSQRTREIGIRIALGSDSAGVLGLILREGALLVAIGLAIGLAGAFAMRDVIASELYGVGTFDPLVVGSVSVTLLVAALIACVVPARRASRVDPVVALAQS